MARDDRFIIPTDVASPEQLQGDDALLNIASDPGMGPHSPDPGGVDQRKQYGNTIQVPIGANPGGGSNGIVMPAINTPYWGDEERDCTLILQPKNVPAAGNGTLVATITYGVGAASLSKVVTLPSANMKRVQLCCRNVQVSIQCVSASGPVGLAQVVVALVPGHTFLRDAYLWSPQPALIDADHGRLVLGPGVLGDLHVILTTAASPGTALYLMLFDSAATAAPANGTAPLPFGVSDVLANLGDSDSFNGLEEPESISFTLGLLACLSTTADTFTAPGAGNQVRVDSLVGQ